MIYCYVDTNGIFHNLSRNDHVHDENGVSKQVSRSTISTLVDGRVFNLAELITKAKQDGLGANFCLVDIIRHYYERDRLTSLSLLDGHFVFVLWDDRKKVLILGSDPIGGRRIYYSKTSRGFLCSSSLTQLVETPWLDKSIAEDGLVEYFSYGYTTPPCTIYKNVFALLPGQYLIFENNTIEIKNYCDPIPEVWEFSNTDGVSDDDLVDKLEQLLVDSVKRRLPEGNRVAAHLSGGLDTSLVCAILKKHTNKEITAITLGSNDPGCDETLYARETAACLDITDQFSYDITKDDFLETLFRLPTIYGQPFADSSAIPSCVIAREVAKDFDAVFTGEGPDGLYGGVDFRLWYYYYMVTSYKLRIPISIFADHMIRWFRKDLISPSLHISELLRQPDFFWIFHKMYKSNELERLLGKPISTERFWGYRFLKNRKDIPVYERLRLAFLTTFITNDVLHKATGAHDANSVVLVCPYHDRKLAEFIQHLPTKYKFRKGSGKYLHKQLLFRYVPAQILNRPKRGFRIDYSEFGIQTLRGLTDEYLNKKTLNETGFINGDFALECVNNYYKGDIRMGPLLWTLLVFEIWRKQFSI